MSSDRRQQVRRVFMEVADLPEAEQPAALGRACGGDAALREEVESLLQAERLAGGFMAAPTLGVPGTTVDSASAGPDAAAASERVGTRIGPYKVLQLIGEGGFGSVYMAEQERPVVRKVALKVIKLGMDTRQVIARFEAERQALAMMDHPNIARVLDAGATEAGRPYFVMELVKGDPIIEYCDKNNLRIEERLDLFAQVCQAVQHAHTKGIIHRDLKPSNILVSTQDGRPLAKIIDFGIAKATASKLTEKTLFTEHRQLIGTPEYMSPEQAEGNLDIDTRTDVYSLGVLLYELLTGTTPFGGTQLRVAAYAEIQRIIREVDPPKPSTRLSRNSDTIASVAAKRHIEPRRLGTIVRGELDWIVMKALEKDRQRRYETANGLAMDIRRYLSGEAVVAAPPSAGYRFKKFMRRNRLVVSAACAVAAALLIGAVGFAWQASVANRQRDLAVAAQIAEAEQRKRADAARAEAQKQAAIAQAIAKFQTDMLKAVDPQNVPRDPVTKEPLQDRVTVVQAMEAAVKELDKGSLKDQPLVEAGVRDALGSTLQQLGRYDDAEPNLRKALEIRRETLPAGHAEIGASLNNLGLLVQEQNRLAEAEGLFREALDIRRKALPAGSPDLAATLGNLASVLASARKFAEAEPLYREALEINRRGLPAGHADIALCVNNLAMLLRDQEKFAEAEPLLREALEMNRKALPAGHPNLVRSLGNLANVLQLQDKLAEAEPLYREALKIRRATLPAGHADLAISLNNLATLLQARNTLTEAEPLYRESLQIRRAAFPAGHPSIARSLNNLGTVLRDQNKPAEAEPVFREALELLRAAGPAGSPAIAIGEGNLAWAQHAMGKVTEARALWDDAIGTLRKASPSGSAAFARLLWRSGSARLEAKDASAALIELQEAVTMAEQFLPLEHPQLKEYRETLERCKAAVGQR